MNVAHQGLLAAALAFAATEPPPRHLTPLPVRLDAAIVHVSAIRELPDGRLFVTDALHPALYLVTPSTGTAIHVGSVGGAPGQYITPGGLYPGAGDSTVVIDRGQTRAFSVSSKGAMGAARSIARRGSQSSSSADADLQRLDAKGLVYFLDRSGVGMRGQNDSSYLLRLDAMQQHVDTVARLKMQDAHVVNAGDGMTFSRTIVGSTADDWAVASDGRVAVVRADPYRVDWITPDGRLTRGAVIAHDALPMTDADKAAFTASIGHRGGGGAGVGSGGHVSVSSTNGGATGSSDDIETTFAATRPPFERGSVAVSPAGHVWVRRNQPLAATTVVYDIFDDAGRRADRVELPATSRIVGFGNGTVYVAVADANGRDALMKLKL